MMQGKVVIFLVIYVIQNSTFLSAILLSCGVGVLLQVLFSKKAW